MAATQRSGRGRECLDRSELAKFVSGGHQDISQGVVQWLKAHLPAGWVEAVEGCDATSLQELRRHLDVEKFRVELGEAGLNTSSWPTNYFGLGFEPELADLVENVLDGFQLPRRVDFIGKSLAGATILQWGTEEQKQHFLYGLATGRDLWCQLFSEPSSGSDLASLATRAVRNGDAWVVNGQKVWSSLADLADYGLLLARTDPDQPKHRGITYFIVDMHARGVQARPLRQMTGQADFNEVFLTDVLVPDTRRLGPVDEGWRVSTTTLGHERSGLSRLVGWGGGDVGRTIQEAKANGRWDDLVLRDRLVRLLIEERILGMTNQRIQSAERSGRLLGPEASITKLFQSTLFQRVANAALDGQGMAALAKIGERPSDGGDGGDAEVQDRDCQYRFLSSRSQTILGGTSEIQRNIIGERALGLQKEPDPWKGQPWREIPRN